MGINLKEIVLVKFDGFNPMFNTTPYSNMRPNPIPNGIPIHGNSDSEDNYEIIGNVSIKESLKEQDKFLCRLDNKNYHFQILCFETLYTPNNYLEICFVLDVSDITNLEKTRKEIEQNNRMMGLANDSSTYNMPVDPVREINDILKECVDNFRENIVLGVIKINYKSFDRKNKIDSILNSESETES